MTRRISAQISLVGALAALALLCVSGLAHGAQTAKDVSSHFARDPRQPIDKEYTAQIKKYTTLPELNTPLTDYLPASAKVPTPQAALGYIAGAPNELPYTETVHNYFKKLASITPRVKVFKIGESTEGRERIVVAVASERLLEDSAENKRRLAQLADPRMINFDDDVAASLIKKSFPVYYITGTIHSPETGAPTALMELAYRLAVDDAPYIKYIRNHVITLITPVVEVDGRDRMVDLYRWHRHYPQRKYPPLLFWGHYVGHSNNRDGLMLTLNLSKNVLDTYLDWHALVLHDLHESVPFLYDNTVGAGAYNPWLDPIMAGGEWHQMAWNNVGIMTKLGLPGVFTHGQFDAWSPGYLMSLAMTHNGIARLYETFGNGGADTKLRILDPRQYRRTWYRQNPPLPKVLWSQRDNNNYEETGLLTSLDYFSRKSKDFLQNFWLKSKRAVKKPTLSGPAAYVLTEGDGEGAKARLMWLVRALQRQHVAVSKATQAFSVKAHESNSHRTLLNPRGDGNDAADIGDARDATPRSFKRGAIIVRMDQPYSMVADQMLDLEYYAPNDPQIPYDDTGWTLGSLFGVKVSRVMDTGVLKVPVTAVASNAVADNLQIEAFGGSLSNQPRIALMHTWLTTEAGGWWRMVLDRLGVRYSYISTQDIARDSSLHDKYDVILFPPVLGTSAAGAKNITERIINGFPMYGEKIPWRKTKLTPNLGHIDSTPDIRPGLGYVGVANLQAFVASGGTLVTSGNTSRFAIDIGVAPGVSVHEAPKTRVVGSVLKAVVVDSGNPIADGYGKDVAMYSATGLSFDVSNQVGGDARLISGNDFSRYTGRGGPEEVDVPQGRPFNSPPELPTSKPWEPVPLNSYEEYFAGSSGSNLYVIPVAKRPSVVFRWEEADKLLVSGLLDHGQEIARRAAVVTATYGRGSVVLFGNDPMYRGETIGSYRMFMNAIWHHDDLETGNWRDTH